MVGEWRGVVVVVPGMHVQCARVLRGEDERVVRAAHARAPRLHAARREPLAERTARHRDQACPHHTVQDIQQVFESATIIKAELVILDYIFQKMNLLRAS